MGKTAHSFCEGEEEGKKERLEKTDEGGGGGGRRKRYCQLHADMYCGFLCHDTVQIGM